MERMHQNMNSADFERDVRELLQLQGWQVTEEKILGHKKIDAYAERPDSLGAIQRLAIECKGWERPLSQNDVTFIYANYHPLIEANLIDTILIVTIEGLAPSASTYIGQTRSLRHLTHSQLLNTLIDFKVHIQGMISAYMADDVSKYYVPQDYSEGEGIIEQYLLDWVESTDTRPVAVLGGYGFGKTTLAKRLAHKLALRCIENTSARIPVIIPLATIATDQTLEGLLGRQFTSITLCHNYNFQLFTSLNVRGRFVFFLDGFDEMKKTMSWDSLVFNLTQLNQLVTPKSKVILLGRPSTFLSSDEQNEALHGRIRRVGIERRVLGWPDYKELHLRPFARRQVSSFIQKYLETLPAENQADAEKRHRVARYLENVESPQGKRLLDLASRPVQLRMLMELLPEYTGPIDRLTVAVLYSEFIDLLLRREAAKPARTAFTKEQRLRFAARLAYWMWQDDQRSDIELAKIPESLFEGYLDKAASDVNLSDIKRDLLSGGFLDRKPPSVFYFPHRSFQEYLVAEELSNLLYNRDSAANDCAYLTPEATSFVIELVGEKGIKQLRKWWSEPAQPSATLKDLINSGCAHYGLDLLDGYRKIESEEDRKKFTLQEREALLRKLEIVGVVSTPSVPSTGRTVKKQSKGKHRKVGVTRKHQYREKE